MFRTAALALNVVLLALIAALFGLHGADHLITRAWALFLFIAIALNIVYPLCGAKLKGLPAELLRTAGIAGNGFLLAATYVFLTAGLRGEPAHGAVALAAAFALSGATGLAGVWKKSAPKF